MVHFYQVVKRHAADRGVGQMQLGGKNFLPPYYWVCGELSFVAGLLTIRAHAFLM